MAVLQQEMDRKDRDIEALSVRLNQQAQVKDGLVGNGPGNGSTVLAASGLLNG